LIAGGLGDGVVTTLGLVAWPKAAWGIITTPNKINCRAIPIFLYISFKRGKRYVGLFKNLIGCQDFFV
jgi:hypothetical protein